MSDPGQSGGERRRNMKVELLHIADCPNIGRARQLLKEALRELGLLEEISDVEVCDSAEAEALAFPGSPTIRVDGKDVEAMFPAQGGYGLACRTYVIDGTRYGVPSLEMIRNAMRSAVELADMEK
jgi:hypothetical protein